jgi:hypothetical protein
MTNEGDIVEVVDEFVDNLDPPQIASEAERLQITVDGLLDRIIHEVKARLDL